MELYVFLYSILVKVLFSKPMITLFNTSISRFNVVRRHTEHRYTSHPKCCKVDVSYVNLARKLTSVSAAATSFPPTWSTTISFSPLLTR